MLYYTRDLLPSGDLHINPIKFYYIPSLRLGTCESFFFRSNRISNRIGRIYHASRNTAWRTAGVPFRPIICWRLALWTNESDVRNWVLVYFNSVLKSVQQCRCTLIQLPKSTLNANLTTTNRFFTNDDWQRGQFENFESGHHYESNLESDVRFEIESNHEASPVPS